MLKKEGKQIYNSLVEYLENTNRFETADQFIIEELATYYQIWHDNKKEISKHGAVQVFEGGSSNINGYFVAMLKAGQMIEKLCHKLGIYEIMKNKLLQYGKMSKEVLSRVK